MPEKTKKRDFVEVEYIGRTDNEVFDTNIPSQAKKINPDANPKPLAVCIGEGLVVKGFDKALEGKEIGKKHKVVIPPEQAYGNRDSKLIKMMPKRVFTEHKMNPVAGMTVSLDNALAKIVSASGGRIMVDMNNPLAGKELEFEFTIKRKITDLDSKINTLQQAFFRQQFPFDLDKEKKKIIFKDLQLLTIVNIFKDKFKDILGYDLEILEKNEGSTLSQTPNTAKKK